MIIDCISDLHGYLPSNLPGGDLLIVAGDLTARDTQAEYFVFRDWIRAQDYKKKIFIAGNHDRCIEKGLFYFSNEWMGAEYLRDSGTEFDELKIYGSPWTKTFEGMNPHCKAFTVDTEEELKEKFDLIPDDIDILVTHSPPHGILDKCFNGNVGSKSLRRIMGRVKPKLWVVGHIHEGYGELKDTTLSDIDYHFVNASHVNEHYEPVNKPIRVIL